MEDETNIFELKTKIENLVSVMKCSNVINKPQRSLAKSQFRTPKKDVGIPPVAQLKVRGQAQMKQG